MIDIHIHGISNLGIEDLISIAKLLKQRGVEGFLPTIYPSSIHKMREDMAITRDAFSHQTQEQAKILGLHLEGPFLNPLKAGALNSNSFLQPTEYNLEKLIDGFEDFIKIITLAPELAGAMKLIKKITDKGIIVSLGHSDATFDIANKAYNSGAKGITHIFNAMRGFHHREPGLAGFGLLNKDIFIEVIADPFHLHAETLKMIFKVKNKDRIIIVSDSVRNEKGSSSGIKNEKEILCGGSFILDKSLEWLIEIGVSKGDLLKAVSDNPKRYLSL